MKTPTLGLKTFVQPPFPNRALPRAGWRPGEMVAPRDTFSAPPPDQRKHRPDAASTISPKDIPPADWTCFVYMNADNNLEQYGITNLEQMQSVGSLNGKMNVIALVDGGTGQGAPGWTAGTRLMYVTRDPSNPNAITSKEIAVDPNSDLGKLLAAGKGELDMGDPKVLHAAVDYVQKNIPSKYFMVDMWDHGNDWHGISYDDNPSDHLTMPTLEQALSGLSQKIDILSTDACLMATDEVADTAKADGIDWLVASEEVEPDLGWNYADFLSRVNNLFSNTTDVGSDQIAKAIADSYVATGTDNVQMSALKLSGLDSVNGALQQFSQAILDAGGLKSGTAARTAYENALRFSDSDMVDLGDFARQLSASTTGPLKTAADQMLAAIRNAEYNDVATGNQTYAPATGISIYGPKWGGIDSTYSAPGVAWAGSKWFDVINTYPIA